MKARIGEDWGSQIGAMCYHYKTTPQELAAMTLVQFDQLCETLRNELERAS